MVNGKGGQDKKNHKWEQDVSWAEFFAGKLARSENDIVLDPFVGSGTTLLACGNLGIPSIGIDSDEQSCEIAAKVHKSYGLSQTQMFNSLSLSPYFLMTEEEYLRQLKNPTEEERKVAKELSKRDDLLAQIIQVKRGYSYGS